MNTFERLIDELDGKVDVVFTDGLPSTYKGFYSDEEGFEVILLSDQMVTCAEKASILAEEIGHYETSTGNILDQRDVLNKKQEIRARRRGHEKLIPITRLIEAYERPCRSRYELSCFLDITEEFIEEAIEQYKMIYGPDLVYDDYYICFEPFGIMKMLPKWED